MQFQKLFLKFKEMQKSETEKIQREKKKKLLKKEKDLNMEKD